MSYDLHIVDPETRETLTGDEPHQLHGGTYQVGGSQEAWLNITYNYAPHFYRVLGEKGIRTVFGMHADASIPVLEAAIAELGDDTSSNYWDATEGNAKKALQDMVALAQRFPQGVWAGD